MLDLSEALFSSAEGRNGGLKLKENSDQQALRRTMVMGKRIKDLNVSEVWGPSEVD